MADVIIFIILLLVFVIWFMREDIAHAYEEWIVRKQLEKLRGRDRDVS